MQKMSKRFFKIGIHMVLAAFSALCVIPILYIVSISFSDEMDLARYGYRLVPRVFSTHSYGYVLTNPRQILTSYGVTIFVTAVGSVMSLLVTAALAYAAARRDFRLSRTISFIVLLMKGFLGNIPLELIESAKIDGSGKVFEEELNKDLMQNLKQ